LVDFRTHVDRILTRSVETFGEWVVFYPKKGGSKRVRAIFDNEYRLVDPNTEQSVSGNQPALGLNLNDVPQEIVVNEDQFEVRGTRFRVVDKQEDGQGGATLLLHKVRVNDRFEDTRAD
jgi:hypothetical protein